jgi:hypothetical protein
MKRQVFSMVRSILREGSIFWYCFCVFPKYPSIILTHLLFYFPEPVFTTINE